ncbi:MAG: hypothetical protein ABUM26_05590 [Solirubrobacterales bacterium]
MSIIDRSPGGFIIIANIVLYSTVLAEAGMLLSGSLLVMAAVMVLIAALAAGLCAFIMRIMGSEAYILGEDESLTSAIAEQVPASATKVRRHRAPRPASTLPA